MISIIGDGIAGLMLAERLLERGREVTVFGDGETNAPPVALVHLFAGRTFDRGSFEVEAFEAAISHWRTEPLAEEFQVRRHIPKGERLDRSLKTTQVPVEFKPQLVASEEVVYGPGFTVAGEDICSRIANKLGHRYIKGKVEPTQIEGFKILSHGMGMAESFPDIIWDLSFGRALEAKPRPSEMHIGHGAHIGPTPQSETSWIGGRFSRTEPERRDELDQAQKLRGQTFQEIREWTGWRCTNARDRWPVIGPAADNTFVFSGFGARAFFWLPYCLEVAIGALVDSLDVPQELLFSRLPKRKSLL